MIERFEQFAFSISTISSYIQKIERVEMAKYGLKGAFSQYLVVMSRFEEGITATQLCKICMKDKAAVSRVISELCTNGFVEKNGENNNLYRAKLVLTEKGKEAAENVCIKASQAAEAAGVNLEEEERQIFYKALEKITANLQKMSKEGIPIK